MFKLKQLTLTSKFSSVFHSLFWGFTLFLIFHSTAYAKTERFFSKRDHFSVQPPLFFNKPKIHREQRNGNVLITMTDDIGTLFRIEQIALDSSERSRPNFVLLKNCLDWVTATIKAALPKAEILDQEILELDNKNLAQLCLFDFPQGSILIDQQNKERFNSMRGSLIFIRDNKYIVLGYQTDLTFTNPDFFPHEVKGVYKRYRTDLINAANSFRIEK